MPPDLHLALARFFAGVFALLVIYLVAVGLVALIDWIEQKMR